MADYAHFKFEGATEGTWPADHPTQPGAIVRQSVAFLSPLPTTAWNEETKEWAIGRWTVTTDPAVTTSMDAGRES